MMIRATSQPTGREEFAGVKWTDNVRAVDPATQRNVLEAATRVTLREPRRRGRSHTRPRITAEEIRTPSERVLRILEYVALGMSETSIVNIEGIRLEAVGHIFRVLSIPKKVSFRQACMNLFGASGIVGCRGEISWRTADGYEEEARAAGAA